MGLFFSLSRLCITTSSQMTKLAVVCFQARSVCAWVGHDFLPIREILVPPVWGQSK